jgi:hypothetical protein
VRQELGLPITGPVQIDLELADGQRQHFNTDSIRLPLPTGTIRLRARATGFRPADSTIVVTASATLRIDVQLPSLTIATPPLEICRRT